MLKLKLISVGKTKEEWLDDAIDEYVKRLKPSVSIEFLWVKNDDLLISAVEKETGVICLDASGQQMTSEQFSAFISKKFEDNGSRLTLVVGGAEGLPAKLKHYPLISMSLMTMTHQIVRLVLMEQLYRAFEIQKGTKYHK